MAVQKIGDHDLGPKSAIATVPLFDDSRLK